jgi:hypothetical protein
VGQGATYVVVDLSDDAAPDLTVHRIGETAVSR